MSDILHRIASWKISETNSRKKDSPLELLQDQALYHAECFSLANTLKNSLTPQIIAEFKRQSPSKGIIRQNADPIAVTMGYQLAGAAAVSVLSDEKFFGAHKNDFSSVRAGLSLPLLRKDFILEEYQVHETKSMGADIILLIAALLKPQEVLELASLAENLGMEVLLEIHGEDELDRVCEPVSYIGVNNRNLKTFDVNLEQSKILARQLPDEIPTIAESGISAPENIYELFQAGFKGFLIGEAFMKTGDPAQNCNEMILASNNLLNE